METASVESRNRAGGGIENRAAPRHPAAVVPGIVGLRLSPHGAAATLVNISGTGLLAVCGIRLKPGAAVTVLFEGSFTPTSATGRVVRCAVAAMGKDGGLHYHLGVSFDKQLTIDAPLALAPEPLPEAAAPEPEPAAAEPAPVPMPVAAPSRAVVVRNRW
jgi:hypothetical protein